MAFVCRCAFKQSFIHSFNPNPPFWLVPPMVPQPYLLSPGAAPTPLCPSKLHISFPPYSPYLPQHSVPFYSTCWTFLKHHMLFITNLPLRTFLARFFLCCPLFLKPSDPSLVLKIVLPSSLFSHISNFLASLLLYYSNVLLSPLSPLPIFAYPFPLLLPLLPFSTSFELFVTLLCLVQLLLMLLFCSPMVVFFLRHIQIDQKEYFV